MITIVIWKSKQGDILGFSTEGHAGYEEEGKDIICASISTLFTTAVNALEEQLGWKDFYMVTGNESNFCEVWTPDEATTKERETAQVILKTIIRGISDVEESVRENYGSKYLRVTTKVK
ncbi:MAG: ribosomal-processing cysteine protease Prp [Clostridiales bacterium]|nr:ribosomal-processing cysteine protease Prp [Clostridiales bacterium]